MRVALVIQKLAGLGGGAERVVVELARELARRGHRPTIVTFELRTDRPSFDVGDVPIVNLMPRALTSLVAYRRPARGFVGAGEGTERQLSSTGNVWPLTYVKWHATHGMFARRLASWLRAGRHDAVVGFLPPAISAVAIAGNATGVARPRLIASTHSAPVEDFGDTDRWDRNPVARRRNLRALVNVDTVTVLQPEFVGQLPAAARDRAVVVPNAVARLAPASGRAREHLVIGVGRLTEQKRYDLLIQAFDRVADDHPEWRLELHGDGPQIGPLCELVSRLGREDRIEMRGATSRIAEVYDRARVLGHPAAFEGFGLAVAEAILHGVAVVAFRESSGVNRIVEPGRSGVLVDTGADPVVALAGGLRTVIEQPPTAANQAAAAASLAERFEPVRIFDLWERLLEGAATVKP